MPYTTGSIFYPHRKSNAMQILHHNHKCLLCIRLTYKLKLTDVHTQ